MLSALSSLIQSEICFVFYLFFNLEPAQNETNVQKNTFFKVN